MLQNNPEIIRWINKHSNETIKQAYSMTKSDILKDEMLRRVFERIDYTSSGRVKIEEFLLIFSSFNISISKYELQCMFNLADKDQSGDLSF
jgi:Ca2+-binding EF-hand superfamily protein